MIFNEAKLDFWIKHNQNVLISGAHGVGKSTVIIQAFNRAGLNWKYFSGSTLDPWVDFCGVPKEVKNPDGTSYLDLIRPKDFQEDQVEAIFIDEFNRTNKKIRNAVLELIQFKSINGKKFKNLRFVWAAINPECDSTYDVEPLDPAQKDRFQVQVEIPHQVSFSYFSQKFGSSLAKAGCSWWDELPEDQKKAVSPRRLDYALEAYQNHGDLRDILPASSGVSKLLVAIKHGPVKEQVDKVFQSQDSEQAQKLLKDANFYEAAKNYIFQDSDRTNFFLPLLSPEQVSCEISSDSKVRDFALSNPQIPQIASVLKNIVESNTNRKLVNRILRELPNLVSKKKMPQKFRQYFSKTGTSAAFLDALSKKWNLRIRTQRLHCYHELFYNLPESLTPDEAIQTLNLLGRILEKTPPADAILDCPKALDMANHCLLRSSYSPEELCKNPDLNTFFSQVSRHKKIRVCAIHPNRLVTAVC